MSLVGRFFGVLLCAFGLQAADAMAQQTICYGLSDGATQLVGVQGQGSTWTPIYNRYISGLSLDSVEALYFDENLDRFYTVDQGDPQTAPDRFGYLDLVSGTFVSLSPGSMGSGTRVGNPTLLEVGVSGPGIPSTGQTTGLALDPTTGYLWGVTLSGTLYRIDVATGTLVQNAFGTDEFARIRLADNTTVTAVEDISFAPDGTMYVVTNSNPGDTPLRAKLYTVNKTGANPGTVISVVDISVQGVAEDEFEGLSFGPDGVLYATTGNGTELTVNRNKMWTINPLTGVATKLYDYTSTSAMDFESIACALAEIDLSVLKTNTPGVNNNIDQASDTVTAGNTVTYSIVARNAGPGLANGTVLRDPATTGLNCTSATCTATGAATCPSATGAAMVSALQSSAGASIATFPPGETVTVTMTCTVN